MNKEQLRELFLCRLYLEIQLFKDRLLNADKEAVFGAAYQIEVMARLYKILAEEAERMPDALFRKMLTAGEGILESFYQEWLKSEDSAYAELKAYVSGELSAYYEGTGKAGETAGKENVHRGHTAAWAGNGEP